MNNNLANHYFSIFKKSDQNEIETLKRYSKVNEYLKSNDWLFISPIFFQGYELSSFLKLSNQKGNNKHIILEVIVKKLYDLKYTASFIEGYCNRCNYIKPFLMSIETSLILTFQKDYEGSIKTLIPIIEGILRKYLIADKGFKTETIRAKDLKNSFNLLKSDLTVNYENTIRNYRSENNILIEFTEKQVNELVKNKEEYYNIWFSFVNDFVNKSFYLNTRGENLTNEINRHSILHEFGLKFEYNLENFMKIYFLLQFLTWAFLRKEQKSILNEIDSYRCFEKIIAYERIIKYSEKLIFEKHLLFKNYANYNENNLKQMFPKFKNEMVSKKHLLIHNIFRKFDKFLWKNNLKKPNS